MTTGKVVLLPASQEVDVEHLKKVANAMKEKGTVVTLPLDFSSVTDESRRAIATATEKAMKERVPPSSYEEYLKTLAALQRLSELEKKVEALELVASYAKDVVDFWPNMSMRTIRVMIPKMDSLKEALTLVK